MPSVLRYEVVGINKYQDVRYLNKSLRFARADAEEIARVLHLSNAFHVDSANSALYTDEFATHEMVWRSLNSIFSPRQNLDSNTIALFYFAGHGLIDPIDEDRIMLGCYDVEIRNPNRGGISLNQI